MNAGNNMGATEGEILPARKIACMKASGYKNETTCKKKQPTLHSSRRKLIEERRNPLQQVQTSIEKYKEVNL